MATQQARDAAAGAVPWNESRPIRRATRSTEGRLLGGVADGLAEHLDVDVMIIRGAFLVSTVAGGFGVVLYAGLWMTLPSDARFEQEAPGLAAASRQGRRPRRRAGLQDVGPLVALAAIALGVVVLLQTLGGGSRAFWPILIGTVGLAVLWRQADEAQRERWSDPSHRMDPVRAVVGRGGAASYARLAAGAGLLVTALVWFAAESGRAGAAGDFLVAGALGVGGLALTVGPWLFRLAGDLAQERAERVRSQERADVAAHLHDSVLQTLALIQKHADDGRTVARLARAQERDLRTWLYAEQVRPEATLAGALRVVAAEVEDAHAVPIEVVTVGDVPLVENYQPLLLAAREAMVNAAKHSGADKVDVYAELGGSLLEVFVRDRGSGFDAGQVAGDRLGIRHSIVDRMRRHDGSAEVQASPGRGVEVRLTMGRGEST
ncbi:MAG: Two-component system sensor histidine kinase [uncultured Nocardioidaceae bacterium]|uniref:Two-component system sensor histidine kinase n=1 Tax=uncultured Nocardioidaceae bacterium TaxID=253824 RepID=A0A6J4M0K2_9ACTN|nr:MAG: Two-component system sensor histidine kinase [uncultured Nocardioidaceae bacterium]